MKKVDNIIEISPKENTSFEKPPSWEVTKR